MEVAVEPAAPVLPDSLLRTAKTIAEQVWGTGTKPRSQYLVGSEANRAEIEQALRHAIDEQWIAVSGDQLVRGSVSPVPMGVPPSESSRAWGLSRSR